MFKAWLPILLIVVATMGCAKSSESQDADPRLPRPVIVSVTEAGAVQVEGVGVEPAGGGAQGSFPTVGLISNEELILTSDKIARVRLLGMSTSTPTMTLDESTVWRPILKFRFRVQEYLKGSGGNTIVGIVHDYGYYDTEAEAQERARWMARAHDARWDGRQAIVLLDSDTGDYPDLPSNWYVLGGIIHKQDNTYSIDSFRSKTWLPAASSATDTSRGSTLSAPMFLLDAPIRSRSGGTSRPRSAPATESGLTISMSAMKTLISGLEARVTAAGGTLADLNCVLSAVRGERVIREGFHLPRFEHALGSGLPAGTLIFSELNGGTGTPPDNIGRQWFEGPDKSIVRFEAVNFRTYRGYNDVLQASQDWVLYTSRFLTTRPLPAGYYRFFHNTLSPDELECDDTLEVGRNLHRNRLTVTAPTRTLHEAFFDPVSIGTAVGANASNGVLEPAAFTVGGASATITSLKWDDGTVTLALSPADADLGDYTLDFIDTTGTTILSLSSANVSTTALTWAVPDQPWADGDLLMLRITPPALSSDATLNNLALSGVDLTFNSSTTEYSATVAPDLSHSTVTATTSHAGAAVSVTGATVGVVQIAEGANTITVVVTAEDGSTQTYSVTITRPPPE